MTARGRHVRSAWLLLLAFGLAGCDVVSLPDASTCPVAVTNRMIPVEDGGELTEVNLQPPYVAEMGGRYGGDANIQLADVSIGRVDWGEAAVEFEVIDPNGETWDPQLIPSVDFRNGRHSFSLDIPGIWQFRLRGLADPPACTAELAIEVRADSEVRARDRELGGSRVGFDDEAILVPVSGE
ncbi:MAG: hypothetical protein M3537_05925 [Chloroflexota bacterium]|nr:hypothetical protein [Chloroflexota bacterium]